MAPELLDRFAAIVGARHALRSDADQAGYLAEPRGLWQGETPLVLRPADTAEVAAIVALAAETKTPLVPRGGGTGLVGAQIPMGDEIVLSLERLNRIREVDPASNTLTAEAGAVLADVQAAAAAAGRLFPLSLASEGSCRIGGNLATNAGGTGVLAYGNTRDLVLGLEVVLADGRVWNGLRKLRKDNTGYDLKNLFIGSEGTLGIVTAAVLKLFPQPAARTTALAAVATVEAALALFELARGLAGPALTACEMMPRLGIDFVVRHAPGCRDPLAAPHPWYVLLELSSPLAGAALDALAEEILAAGLKRGMVRDATIAGSAAQAAALWALRERLSEVQRFEGGSIKHDVSVPLARVPELIALSAAAFERLVPGSRPLPFGHLGDGNIHLNVNQPVGADKAAFLARWDEVNAAVHAIVAELGGSISAEHGIGRLKRHLLPTVKDPVEMALMRSLKATLDPGGILSPGRVL